MKTTAPILIILSVIAIAFLPATKAVSPPPDGAYPGGNTAEGQNALLNLTTGGFNTAVGWLSLRGDMAGAFNTAIGAATLVLNTGNENTAVGVGALLSNGSGFNNTAIGTLALFSNSGGYQNNAFGTAALNHHMTGSYNIAVGGFALFTDQTGAQNNAIGDSALFLNVSGGSNTAVGDSALLASTGNLNTALGASAGSNVTSANNVICIGAAGADLDNSCYIGNIYGATIDPATATIAAIDSTGKLGTTASARRFKRDIEPMEKASDAILSLKPVIFHYKSDTKNTPCFGLIAEEVAAVNPDLVVRDKEGQPYTVRYDQVNAMLLNEFLKEHHKVEKQDCKLQEQGAMIARQQKQIEALIAGLQRVSAQLELSKAAPQTVLNNQ
ncbi:MAG: tail fiber domain-containing protein [Nitrospirota bacterium]